MESNFDLPHVVLYAKGWYERTNDIYADLRKMLVLDGFEGWNNKADIFRKMVSSYSNYNEWRRNNGLQYKTIYDFINDINHYRWRFPEDKADANCYIIYAILAEYVMTNPCEIEMATPLYYKGVRNNDKKQGQTYKEMNAKAQKMFKK